MIKTPRTFFLFFAFIGFALQSIAQEQTAPPRSQYENMVISFLLNMQSGAYAKAHSSLDASITEKINPEQLEAVAKQLVEKYGPWTGSMVTSFQDQGETELLVTDNDFENATIKMNVIVNDKGKIIGFTIREVNSKISDEDLVSEFAKQEKVSVTVDGGTLKGTLLIPNKGEKDIPVVLIIAGSGPTDRDGNSPMGITAKSYKLLAEGLAAKGIASLRYDKRMIGESAGFAKKQNETTIDDFAKDAVACIKHLKTDMRFNRVVVAGHSEGSLVGLLAMKKEKVDGFISLAGIGRSIDEILLDQIKKGASAQQAETAATLLASLKKSATLPEVTDPQLKMIFNDQIAVFIHSAMQHTPAQMIKDVKCPILIVNGTTDIQVPETEAKLLAKANPKAQLLVIENMNHVLKDAPADVKENAKTYSNPDLPLSAGLIPGIEVFINDKVR